MKNKQKTQPTKKRILMYYLILAACLLVIAAVTVGVVFGVRANNNLPSINVPNEPNNPDKPDKPDEPVVDTSTKYEFIVPVQTVNVTQTHVLWHNKTLNIFRLHNGMDFGANAGTEVYAAVDGTVKSVNINDRLYGAVIEIEHADGVRTVYKFVEPVSTLKAGDTVNRGDVIATVATATGVENADGEHLHFEVYKNNTAQDPDLYLNIISK